MHQTVFFLTNSDLTEKQAYIISFNVPNTQLRCDISGFFPCIISIFLHP